MSRDNRNFVWWKRMRVEDDAKHKVREAAHIWFGIDRNQGFWWNQMGDPQM
jgi:hypothetical protein